MGRRRRAQRSAAKVSRESGQTASELAIIIGLLAVFIIVGVVALRADVIGSFDRSSQQVGAFKPPVVACDSNYRGVCIPEYPPDLDCSDLAGVPPSQITVTGSDPHGLDPDGDGVACN